MNCPEQIKQLYMAERERRRAEGNFLELNRRKGRFVDHGLDLDLLSESKAKPLLSAWYSFHEKANHETYSDFYSKVLYCQRLNASQIDPDTFLELIADREFLFLEYAEAYIADYPLLSNLVKSADAEASNYPTGKQEKVLDQVFVPTGAHSSDYTIWQRNLTELTEALAQRRDQIARLTELPKSFRININYLGSPSGITNEIELSPIESSLSELFRAYFDACSKAGTKWYSNEANRAKQLWRVSIHTVMDHLEKADIKIPGASAIVFFHLFTQKAEKLSDGTLKRYTFEPIEQRKSYLEDPTNVQKSIHARVRCNILLYDQLLELFIKHEFPNGTKDQLAQYRADAKFLFYKYSRFDRYWHYDLTRFWSNGVPNINFGYSENYKDGVDFFGNLLRFHIKYSMSNTAQWLIPTLSIYPQYPPLSVLATYLLAEGSSRIAAKNRLLNRVQSISKSKLAEMLKTYENHYLDEKAKQNDLRNWVEDHKLRIPTEDELLYEEEGMRPLVQKCGQYVLEFFLRDRLIKASKNALYKIAKIYFDDLCFGEFSYGDTGPTY